MVRIDAPTDPPAIENEQSIKVGQNNSLTTRITGPTLSLPTPDPFLPHWTPPYSESESESLELSLSEDEL